MRRKSLLPWIGKDFLGCKNTNHEVKLINGIHKKLRTSLCKTPLGKFKSKPQTGRKHL